MLNLRQIREILRACLSQIIQPLPVLQSNSRLSELGIRRSAQLEKLKSLIVVVVTKKDYRIVLQDLDFGRDSRLFEVIEIISKAAERPRRGEEKIVNPSRESLIVYPTGAGGATDVYRRPDSPTTRLGSEPVRNLECTPQMEIHKILGPKSLTIAVFVDQGSEAPGSETTKVNVTVPAHLKTLPLNVWFDCSRHFKVEEGSESAVEVDVQAGTSDKAFFRLTLVKAPDENPMYMAAYFQYEGRPSGKILRYCEMIDGKFGWKTPEVPRKQEGETILPNANTPPTVSLDLKARKADIFVEVLGTEANDGQHFRLHCRTPEGEWRGAWNLPQTTKDLVEAHLATFTSSSKPKGASLEGVGIEFWKVLPKKMQPLLWTALTQGAKTMSVLSEEPYIPWELMVPHRTLHDKLRPLGIELCMGRWITGNYISAPIGIPMKSCHVIRPSTSGLTHSGDEADFLTKQLKPNFEPVDEVIPPSYQGVDQTIGDSPRHVIHFICHGKSEKLQTLELEDPDTLDCVEIKAMKGFLKAFKGGPFVFLNACEVGGQVASLGGVGGFANSFIELGASAVIAPLWAIQDDIAFEVTKRFYKKALKGGYFSEIMKEIRAEAYSQGIDSYAAYCFYGDPMAAAL